jgi:hypothetical protein
MPFIALSHTIVKYSERRESMGTKGRKNVKKPKQQKEKKKKGK